MRALFTKQTFPLRDPVTHSRILIRNHCQSFLFFLPLTESCRHFRRHSLLTLNSRHCTGSLLFSGKAAFAVMGELCRAFLLLLDQYHYYFFKLPQILFLEKMERR